MFFQRRRPLRFISSLRAIFDVAFGARGCLIRIEADHHCLNAKLVDSMRSHSEDPDVKPLRELLTELPSGTWFVRKQKVRVSKKIRRNF